MASLSLVDKILVTRQLLADRKDLCTTTSMESHDFSNVKYAVETAIMNILFGCDYKMIYSYIPY